MVLLKPEHQSVGVIKSCFLNRVDTKMHAKLLKISEISATSA